MRPLLALCALLGAALAGCGKEYVCPDPIGRIVRDDCDDYKTRYESLKVSLGFSIGKLGFSVEAGKEKLRDPSELLQMLMQQSMAMCKDFNACRVPMPDYQRRREESDRKFTAITAITQQLKGDLDTDSKRKLVAKLIDVITDASAVVGSASGDGRVARRFVERPRFTPGMFRSSTSIWFGSRFQPPLPALPPGVPVVANWEVYGRNLSGKEGLIHLTLWGKTQVDDRIYLALSEPVVEASEKVRPMSGRDEGRASFHLREVRLRGRGTMTISYRPGATGQKHVIGTTSLDARTMLGRGYLSYMPDPVQSDSPDYERIWVVFYTRLDDKTKVTLRCDQNGKPEPAVLEGTSWHASYDAARLRRHHIELPIRIPLKGGKERGQWRATHPGEKLPVDRFPSEAAGLWACRASLNGRVARRFEFRLRADGSVVPWGTVGKLAPPWWPIKTEQVDNDLEREREREIADEDAAEEKREREREERMRQRNR
jgi:hypothetical protein